MFISFSCEFIMNEMKKKWNKKKLQEHKYQRKTWIIENSLERKMFMCVYCHFQQFYILPTKSVVEDSLESYVYWTDLWNTDLG